MGDQLLGRDGRGQLLDGGRGDGSTGGGGTGGWDESDTPAIHYTKEDLDSMTSTERDMAFDRMRNNIRNDMLDNTDAVTFDNLLLMPIDKNTYLHNSPSQRQTSVFAIRLLQLMIIRNAIRDDDGGVDDE